MQLFKKAALTLSLALIASAPLQAVPTELSVRLDKPHSVKDLAYGEFLFDFYQERYFSAISKAMVAEKRGLLKHHNTQTQVLLGSLYVGYGMLDEAEAIFNNLLQSAASVDIRNRVWFHLSEVYYKRGSHEKSVNIIQTHINNPQASLKDDVELLFAQNLIATNKLEEAQSHLKNIIDNKDFSRYAKFNLASAHSMLGDNEKANELYYDIMYIDRPIGPSMVATIIKFLNLSPKIDTSLRSVLTDRAALALGTSLLKSEDWARARSSFESVKFNGASSNTALLGLGWSYFYEGDLIGTLAPWRELANRNPSDPAVQEAMLNLSYVYEKAGALKDAIGGYRSANEHYFFELELLEDLQHSISQTDWINNLTPPASFSLDPLDEVGDFDLPRTELSNYLYQFYASHEFHESFRDYRELQRLKQLLNHWQIELPAFDQMVESNVSRLNKLYPKAQQAVGSSQQLLLKGANKLVDFTNRIKKAIRENDVTITATDQQSKSLKRLSSLEKEIEKLPYTPEYDVEREKIRVTKGVIMWDLDSSPEGSTLKPTRESLYIKEQIALMEQRVGTPDYDDERERFRITQGVLMWDLNETAIERRWERSKDKMFIENQLGLLEKHIQRVVNARNKHVNRYDGFRDRIEALNQRLSKLQDRSLDAILHHQSYLKNTAKQIIAKRQTYVRRLQANTIFSIARLQDMAYTNDSSSSATEMDSGSSLILDMENAPSDGTSETSPFDNPTKKSSFEEPSKTSLFGDGIRSVFGF